MPSTIRHFRLPSGNQFNQLSHIPAVKDPLAGFTHMTVSHALPGEASMVAITRYYIAPPVASGYYLQP
jgi:hypothetical protein